MSQFTIVTQQTERGLRYFTEPKKINGFDGTAQGWGYKTASALHRAYAFHINKDKIKAKEHAAKQFLRDNPDVKAVLRWYFDPDWELDRMKDGEEGTIAKLIVEYADEHPEAIRKLESNKHLHRAILHAI